MMAHWRKFEAVYKLAFAFVFSFVLPSAEAQSTNASLTGRVADPSKAVIAGAKVAAVSASTDVRYETTVGICSRCRARFGNA